MKPDKNTCLNCGKQISLRAKYCSDKCRKQYERNPDKRSDKHNPDTPKTQLGHELGQNDLRSTLSKTDKTFYDRALKDFKEPYYDFNANDRVTGVPIKREGKCGFCGAKFTTTLLLNKYCSYDHYHNSLKTTTA